MTGAQTKDAANGKTSKTQVMIQCRQRQWNSGQRKDEYCEGCPRKKECFELFGR